MRKSVSLRPRASWGAPLLAKWFAFSLIVFSQARAGRAQAPATTTSPAPPPKLPEDNEPLPPAQVWVKETSEAPELIQFSGNLVFNDYALRAMLLLPKGAGPDVRTAQAIVVQLTRFLKKAGYDLARVEATADGHFIHVDINEGHLDKVIITGESAVNTIRLRLELQQPFDVFNRPELEARLRALSTRMNLTDASYTIVKTHELPQTTPKIFEQLQAMKELRDAGLLSSPGVYELHISIRQGTWGKGFSPEVVIGGLDGLGIGGVFHGSRLLPIDDRWEARVRGAVASLTSLNGLGSQLVLSRALAELHYWGPPLFARAQSFRPGLLLSSDLLEQSRRDLGYDLFRRETLQGALGVGDTVNRNLFFAAGAGLQARWFYDLDDPGQTGLPLQPAIPRQLRPMLLATLHYLTDPGQLRSDFRSPARLTAQLFHDDSQFSYRLDASFDYALPLGWHELRWDLHAFAIGGEQQFFDQEVLSDYMQNEFNYVFTKHLVEAGWEFRYSLLRDQLKVGLLAHLVEFGQLSLTPGAPEQSAFAASVGIGLHTLVYDAINIDADLSIGRRTGTVPSIGGPMPSTVGGPAFSLNLSQVY